MLLTACSTAGLPAAGIACHGLREARPSPELRDWLKSQCGNDGRCAAGVPGDLPAFVTTIAGNNAVLRDLCGAGP